MILKKWNDQQNGRVAALLYNITGKKNGIGNGQYLYVKKINTKSNGGTAYVTIPNNERKLLSDIDLNEDFLVLKLLL